MTKRLRPEWEGAKVLGAFLMLVLALVGDEALEGIDCVLIAASLD